MSYVSNAVFVVFVLLMIAFAAGYGRWFVREYRAIGEQERKIEATREAIGEQERKLEAKREAIGEQERKLEAKGLWAGTGFMALVPEDAPLRTGKFFGEK